MVIGKKTRSDDCNRSDEIWAMSYSVIGGIISANTAPLSWKFRLFEREELTGSTQEQNRWLKTASGKAITRKLYSTRREKEEKGVLHNTWRKWKISFGIWLPGVAFDGMDLRKFYYAMTFYQKPDLCLNIVQRTSNMSRRIIDYNPLEQRAR